nr:DUF6542 domain-containing protein [Tsukamurella sp. PLM1]
MPVDERSVLATVPGLPWWGAVITLLAFTAVGALVAGEYTGVNAGVLAMAVGAIVAVLAVRNRALFTAMVQPAGDRDRDPRLQVVHDAQPAQDQRDPDRRPVPDDLAVPVDVLDHRHRAGDRRGPPRALPAVDRHRPERAAQ